MSEQTTPRVHIVGAGLIGTSLGIGLSSAGWDVTIEDADAASATLARSLGAGGEPGDGEPDLIVIAVPPAIAGAEVAAALTRHPGAVVTDVASVKLPIADQAHETGHGDRYVGSHPMSGREVSGGLAAQGDLFKARPWVLCRNGATDAAADSVRALAEALGADVVEMDAAAHDRAVARVSHAPQIVSSAVAAALGQVSAEDVALAGQGLRDVTRIAASEPRMWEEISRLNAHELRETIAHIVEDLSRVRDASDAGAAVAELIERGREQVARIPGKHGGRERSWAHVTVIVPDEPGQLLRLLTLVADAGVNVEDLRIEHSPQQPVGLTRLSIDPTRLEGLLAALDEAGWAVAAS